MGKEAPFDTARAHRWFASALNNMVWQWLEDSKRDQSRTEDMIHAAHASCHHWTEAGTAIHRARAEYLVANVHAAAGNTDSGLRFAQRALTGLEAEPEGLSDWDLAFAADAMARVFAAAGSDEAQHWLEEAEMLGAKIADPEDKAIFDRWRSIKI